MPAFTVREYAAEVTRILETAESIDSAVNAIAPLKRRLLDNPDLVPPICYEGLADVKYTRNLLYGDPEGRFVVMALVWNPAKESPVHDHETWGVVGTYTAGIHVTNYSEPEKDGRLRELNTARLDAKRVVKILPPRESNIHKMGNPGTDPVVTIHTYGDRALAARIYDPGSGEKSDVALKYHHVVAS